ncbi:replication protein [Acinetobacter baumannii]|uniref:replication protein n=1 Tax=Acinetobacter baumannii TaxID=470 RepID=UPI0002BB482B|nr:replication protein [Acinetobacter baumannii]MDC5618205.1 replication protein [Acinetobacter baumannii]
MKLIPNSFQMPNAFVDEVMVKLNDPAVKIYLVIVRKTRGWHKEFDSISLSQFERFTGKSRPTVVKSLNELTKAGLIKKVASSRNGEAYALNDDFNDGWLMEFTSKGFLLVKEFNYIGKGFLPLMVKGFNTQNTLSKHTNKTHKNFDQVFAEFWKAYPNHKAGIPKTKEALKKAIKTTSFETIMSGLKAWKATQDWSKENGKYVPYSTKFLNQELWTAFDNQPISSNAINLNGNAMPSNLIADMGDW